MNANKNKRKKKALREKQRVGRGSALAVDIMDSGFRLPHPYNPFEIAPE